VRVRADRDTSGINAKLSIGGTISGRVTNAAGKPLKGECVLAEDVAAFSAAIAFTGSNGRYSIHGLSTGAYTVYIEQCTNNSTLAPVGRAVRVAAPKARNGINAVLRPGGAVAGMVTLGSPVARPAADVCVEVDSSNPLNPGGFALVGANGRYDAT